MKKKVKEFLLKLKYGDKSTSKGYYKKLKKAGISLGDNVVFYSPWTINIDTQRPWMIEIGNDVHITAGVKILQHGYDWAVIQKKYGEVCGSCGKVKIGNNVFIGTNTTILKNVEIGDNVIIGANSLVNKDCKKEGVYAGNPAKFIMTLEDYYKKRKDSQVNEATELILEYYKKNNNQYPTKDILREYFWIFEERNNELCRTFEDVLKLKKNYDLSLKKFKNTKPIFYGYEEFIKYVEQSKDINNS